MPSALHSIRRRLALDGQKGPVQQKAVNSGVGASSIGVRVPARTLLLQFFLYDLSRLNTPQRRRHRVLLGWAAAGVHDGPLNDAAWKAQDTVVSIVVQ